MTLHDRGSGPRLVAHLVSMSIDDFLSTTPGGTPLEGWHLALSAALCLTLYVVRVRFAIWAMLVDPANLETPEEAGVLLAATTPRVALAA